MKYIRTFAVLFGFAIFYTGALILNFLGIKILLILPDLVNRTIGYLFLNKDGKQITTRGIAHQLKALAKKYKMNLNVIYPHSFRHRFAKNFLEKQKDIALLADLMGHESIETTRIYLRKTSEEQQEIVDNIIDW